MSNRIKQLKASILNKQHHKYRQNIPEEELEEFTAGLARVELPYIDRAAKRLEFVFDKEIPVVLPDEKIAYFRTLKEIPEILTQNEWETIKRNHYVHELGKVCNISPNYEATIAIGLEAQKEKAQERLNNAKNEKEAGFLEAVIKSIDLVLGFNERYIKEAERAGNEIVVALLKRVPRYGARTFNEALQMFRILHYTLWASYNYHNTVGRFDKYMYPYLKADLDSGRLTKEKAMDLLMEFFLTFNKDSDLYPGMQQGDNGQSLVLGGLDDNEEEVNNILTEMCLRASLELNLIDPKINLRVNKNTSLETYELGSQLTKRGLGFPQYSNDDVVIPGLIEKGYAPEDARDYVVAACWEFIIPGKGMDIPNIGALSYLDVIEKAVDTHLSDSINFETFMGFVKQEMQKQVDEIIAEHTNVFIEPAPFMSVLMEGCIENAKDISEGAKYNNYGLHGTGLSNTVDSLAAIKKHIFDERTVKASELIAAINSDFDGYDSLRYKLKYDSPKMGNDDDITNGIAIELVDMFIECLEGKRNERGGIYRAGTGSAMYYVWHAKDAKASADGRKRGEFLSANYAPSLNVKNNGPISVIESFAKPNLKGAINGGPLTMEIHDSVFADDENITKVAMLVEHFMDIGGHQLQINTINRDTLIDAQNRPELYRNLIVRVWGWSGYFVELDKEYQDHIIQRVEFLV